MPSSSENSNTESIRERRLTEAVMGYLSEHPEAMDTLEGIAHWWIMRHRVREDVETIARVLERLTLEGVLERIGSGESARYRLKTR